MLVRFIPECFTQVFLVLVNRIILQLSFLIVCCWFKKKKKKERKVLILYISFVTCHLAELSLALMVLKLVILVFLG